MESGLLKVIKMQLFYNYDNETVDSVEIINGMAHILKTREDEKTLLLRIHTHHREANL